MNTKFLEGGEDVDGILRMSQGSKGKIKHLNIDLKVS